MYLIPKMIPLHLLDKVLINLKQTRNGSFNIARILSLCSNEKKNGKRPDLKRNVCASLTISIHPETEKNHMIDLFGVRTRMV